MLETFQAVFGFSYFKSDVFLINKQVNVKSSISILLLDIEKRCSSAQTVHSQILDPSAFIVQVIPAIDYQYQLLVASFYQQ